MIFSGYMPQRGIAGSYNNSIFRILRNLQGFPGDSVVKNPSANAGIPRECDLEGLARVDYKTYTGLGQTETSV